MNTQATYRQNIFSTVEEMDQAVNNHIYYNANELPESNRKILKVLASHAFKPIGTCRLKISTIAKEVGCSEVTVNRGIKRLKALDIIDVQQGTKLNGIQGANYYSILNFNHVMKERVQHRELTERVTHETPRSSKVEHVTHETESFHSFKTAFNPFVEKNVVTYNACGQQDDLKQRLRAIYNPSSVEGNQVFEELCKIAYGRLKQGLQRNVPYIQMADLIVRCMEQLINKKDVRNIFALYSKMIERQTNQLFEQPVQPINKRNKEMVPEWFAKRNEPSTVVNNDMDYEAERQKILAKLG